MTEEEIKGLGLPKLRAYLEEIQSQIENDIKLHGGEVESEPKEATVSDIRNLFGWMNGSPKKGKKHG